MSIAVSVGTNPTFIRRIIDQLSEYHLIVKIIGVNRGGILTKNA